MEQSGCREWTRKGSCRQEIKEERDPNGRPRGWDWEDGEEEQIGEAFRLEYLVSAPLHWLFFPPGLLS
jgi:hypothetical protein